MSSKYKNLDLKELKKLYKSDVKIPVLIDVKGILNKDEAIELGYNFWRM